jgi:hypothetical protein
MQPYAAGIENPHELIGVAADETDPRLVMETAARRIARLRAVAGSEFGVRRALIASIIVARNEILGRIATGEHATVRGPRTTVVARE